MYCSFCGKNQDEVRNLIAGPSVFICDECIELCNDIIGDGLQAGTRESPGLLTVDTLVARADNVIPGQRLAKRALAAALLEAVLTMRGPLGSQGGGTILVLGATGSGAREVILEMTKVLQLPRAIVDVPLLYSGATFVESYPSSDFRGKDGAIVIDHVETLLVAERSEVARQLQHALVTMLDSRRLRVADDRVQHVDAKNAIIIGICELAGRDESKHVECDDLLTELGFIPTLAARFGIVVAFGAPDHDAYESMLLRSGGLFEQYQDSLEKSGRRIQFSPGCACTIATAAVRRNDGFLGLQTLMRQICQAIVCEMPLWREETTAIEPQWVSQVLHGNAHDMSHLDMHGRSAETRA
nr:ClpX C4-type zinc finger protein [Aromatoleum evansii]